MQIEEIAAIWRSEGIEMHEPTLLTILLGLEKFVGYEFPASFKNFYQLANGFKQHNWTAGMFYMWSVEEIRQEWKQSSDQDFIPFCDYLMNSHQIGFLKSKPGVFKRWPGLKDEPTCFVADNFAEALRFILEDAPQVN